MTPFESTKVAMLAELIRQRTARFLPGTQVQEWRDPATAHFVVSFRIPEETLFDHSYDSNTYERVVLSIPAEAADELSKQSARVRTMAIAKLRMKRQKRLRRP